MQLAVVALSDVIGAAHLVALGYPWAMALSEEPEFVFTLTEYRFWQTVSNPILPHPSMQA